MNLVWRTGDLSLFKNFRLGASEQRRIQFRAEAYNVFNHTQFTAVDIGSRWDAQGNQINSNLGFPTTAALGRRIVLRSEVFHFDLVVEVSLGCNRGRGSLTRLFIPAVDQLHSPNVFI